MADLHRPTRELVDLGGLAGEPAPMSDFKVAKGNQAFQVLEGKRAVNTSLAGNRFHAARLAVGVEAEQHVAPREIAQSAKCALHVSTTHHTQHSPSLEGMSAAEQELDLPER